MPPSVSLHTPPLWLSRLPLPAPPSLHRVCPRGCAHPGHPSPKLRFCKSREETSGCLTRRGGTNSEPPGEQRAPDTHLSGPPGSSQAGGRLESGGARRRGGRGRPGREQRPPAAPPRGRQHEQAGRINKWVPFGALLGRAGGGPGASLPGVATGSPGRPSIGACVWPSVWPSGSRSVSWRGSNDVFPLNLLAPPPAPARRGGCSRCSLPTSPASPPRSPLLARCGRRGRRGALGLSEAAPHALVRTPGAARRAEATLRKEDLEWNALHPVPSCFR